MRSAVVKTNKAANNAATASCFMNISFKYAARSTNNYGGGASSRAVCGLPAIFTGRPHTRVDWCPMREPFCTPCSASARANSSWFVCRLPESNNLIKSYIFGWLRAAVCGFDFMGWICMKRGRWRRNVGRPTLQYIVLTIAGLIKWHVYICALNS